MVFIIPIISRISKATSRNFHQQTSSEVVHGVAKYVAIDRKCVASTFQKALSQKCQNHKLWGLSDHFIIPQDSHQLHSSFQSVRFMCNGSVNLYVRNGIVRFDIGDNSKRKSSSKLHRKRRKEKKSEKSKAFNLRFFRLKVGKKLRSANPEVRLRYRLEKARRKESWLVQKLLKYEMPTSSAVINEPEKLTAEERFYLKRIGKKHKNYVPVGVRGIIGGVVLNMHLHWKNHETVKVRCKPCKPGQIQQYAEEISRLSGGTVIDIMDNVILFYRGKNYVRPEVLSPRNTLSKKKALEKYRYEQSLEEVRQVIGELEKELEVYHKHTVPACNHTEVNVKGDVTLEHSE